jgi:excisionase family DNA binding protein
MIRPQRSCSDAFACVHIHFDDEEPQSPHLELHNSAREGPPNRADNEKQSALTLTIPEAAEILGISVSKAYEAARLGQIPTIRLGTRILVSRRRLEEMIDGYTR